MAQIIDIKYLEKVESQTINERLLDITGPSILQGFRVVKGSGAFDVSIDRGDYDESVAIMPNGARIRETTNLFNQVTIPANTGNERRIDSIYLKYQYGTNEAVATYELIAGTHLPAHNPNPFTHLLLAYVYVPENSAPISIGDIVPMPYGFHHLTVGGDSIFNGPVVFNQDVTFRANVNGGAFTGDSGDPTMVHRLPNPIIATANQTDFTLPETYVMGTNSLFVYKNGLLMPPSEWMEVTNTTFRFYTPLAAGDKVWAFWYDGLNMFAPEAHDHDDLYYRKFEVNNRLVRTATDFFAGNVGRVVTHNLNSLDYVVISVIPTTKTTAVGVISVEKRLNELVVYNEGSYRGQFDVTYMLRQDPNEINLHYQAVDFTVESSRYNSAAKVYEEVIHRRRTDGTVHMKTTLSAPNGQGFLTRLRVDYYNNDGTQIYQTKVWALTYDTNGKIKLKSRIS